MQTNQQKEVSKRMRQICRLIKKFGWEVSGACGRDEDLIRAFAVRDQALELIRVNVVGAVAREHESKDASPPY